MAQTQQKAKQTKNDFNNFLQNTQKQLDERKKAAEKRTKEQQQRLEQMSKLQSKDKVQIYVNQNTTTKKNNSNYVNAIQEEATDNCTCGCNIF